MSSTLTLRNPIHRGSFNPNLSTAWIRGVLLCSIAMGNARIAHARPDFLGVLHGTLNIKKGGTIDRASCSVCHAASGPPDWNPFGKDVHAALQAKNTHALTAELLRTVLKMDSDSDGYSNGEEIAADSLPGDAKSHPSKHLAVVAIVAPTPPQNPFSPAAILLAKDAQHPALVHFPIALFIASVALDLLGKWKKNQAVLAAATVNLLLAALSTIPTLVSGILAWRLKFEGTALTGNLLLHFIGGLTTTAVIWALLALRRKSPPGRLYFAIAAFGLLAVSITGHLGGMVSGVAN